MARRRFRTVNLPVEVVGAIDVVIDAAHAGTVGITLVPLGVQSRDEFVRLAVTILLLGSTKDGTLPTGLEALRQAVLAAASRNLPMDGWHRRPP